MTDMPFRSVPRARSLGKGSNSIVSREIINIDDVQVTVLRKKNRNMYLRIKPPYGAIEVTAPMRMSRQMIVSFVRERRGWIDQAQHKMAQARARTFSPDGSGGARMQAISAIASEGDSSSRERERGSHPLIGDSFTWNNDAMQKARESIESQLPTLLRTWIPIIGREPSKITLRAMTSRWGSCTPKTRRIRLNLQLGLMDPKFLEYVLVHEMVHLWENGHGEGFKRRMSDVLPNWKEARRELNRCTIMQASETR